ncbi:MAG: aspartate racemase [Thermoplasmata archaeon M8B2D]|nr:MAG: aspartate racemase [Thermoplasmata archaeon M8B2D]
MKTIGLIGGTSWLSTLEYYRIINETVNEKLGDAHSARCILYSVDFEEDIVKNEYNWDKIIENYIDIAIRLERFGADFLIICANTVHKIVEGVQKSIKIPILHIADATGIKIVENGLKKVGLLGTRITMEENFYKDRLKEKFGIETIIPKENEREIIHKIIHEELTYNIIRDSSKQRYIKIIRNLVDDGAQGIILGCTEIPLLIKQNDVEIPVFDTTNIHAKAAVDYACLRIY